MSGKVLYDRHCSALVATKNWQGTAYGTGVEPAWAFLTYQKQRYWNDLARRVTPKRKAKS